MATTRAEIIYIIIDAHAQNLQNKYKSIIIIDEQNTDKKMVGNESSPLRVVADKINYLYYRNFRF